VVRSEAGANFLLAVTILILEMVECDAGEIIRHSEAEELEALYGPIPLPGNGTGNITGAQRKVILDHTGCSAAVRQRSGWDCRKLTIIGPSSNLMAAKVMAHAYILQCQRQPDVAEVDTPGSENDRFTTKQTAQDPNSKAAQRKRKRDNRKMQERDAVNVSGGYRLQPLTPWMMSYVQSKVTLLSQRTRKKTKARAATLLDTIVAIARFSLASLV